jgi:hypothetical protein
MTEKEKGTDMVAHTCNPSTQETEAGDQLLWFE